VKLRLSQVFAAKTAEFCEPLSPILGIKVVFSVGAGHVAIRSRRRGTLPLQVAVRRQRECSLLHRARKNRRSCCS
jgi:hypothetical protein